MDDPSMVWGIALSAVGLLVYVAWREASVRFRRSETAQQRLELRRVYQQAAAERDQLLDQLERLRVYGRQLSSAPTRRDVYRLLLRQCAELVDAKPSSALVSLWRYDPTQYSLVCDATLPSGREWLASDRVSLTDAPISTVIADGKPVILPQAPESLRKLVARPLPEASGAALLPIIVEGRPEAAVLLLCPTDDVERVQQQRRAVSLLMLQGGLCLENLLHRELAMFDHLTRVHNFAYFQERLTQELQRCHRFELPLSLLLIDLDHFKQINDTHGHQAGDWVLLSTVQVMKSAIRSVDLLARYGGDEFVVMLPETGSEGTAGMPEALAAAQRIRLAIAQHDYQVAGRQLRITASIGISVRAPGAPATMTAAALFKDADEQLYRAKQAGRNRCAMGGEPMLDGERGTAPVS